MSRKGWFWAVGTVITLYVFLFVGDGPIDEGEGMESLVSNLMASLLIGFALAGVLYWLMGRNTRRDA